MYFCAVWISVFFHKKSIKLFRSPPTPTPLKRHVQAMAVCRSSKGAERRLEAGGQDNLKASVKPPLYRLQHGHYVP